ncbi:MAG: hypothetical protein V7K41_21125 [Nostoc sp.]|uniref:hypothetical protein n=1 Tax=Nostoc sp. TaxID=1180 RepID=UPI002FFC7C1B
MEPVSLTAAAIASPQIKNRLHGATNLQVLCKAYRDKTEKRVSEAYRWRSLS